MTFRSLRILLFALLVLLAVFSTACGPPTSADSGGSGSEIVGNVQKDSTGTAKLAANNALVPAINTIIYLIPDDSAGLIDLRTLRTTTNSSGHFAFSNVPLKTWYIKALSARGTIVLAKVVVDKPDTTYDVGLLNLF